MPEFSNLLYEKPEPEIARIWLNREDTRNAQDTALLDELNTAFDVAVADPDVKVIVLAAKGPDFSSGHDLREEDWEGNTNRRQLVGTWHDPDWSGVQGFYCREKEIYEGYSKRWRDIAKPTIVSVQGKVIASGLLLVWPFDFIIASEDATFQDNTLYMGIPGVEYFAHVWELGIRKAKEFLLTGQPITAAEARDAGMVNRVVPNSALEEETLNFARTMTDKASFPLKLAKDSINSFFAATGFDNVQKAAFNAHHLAHNHYRIINGIVIDQAYVQKFMERKSSPGNSARGKVSLSIDKKKETT